MASVAQILKFAINYLNAEEDVLRALYLESDPVHYLEALEHMDMFCVFEVEEQDRGEDTAAWVRENRSHIDTITRRVVRDVTPIQHPELGEAYLVETSSNVVGQTGQPGQRLLVGLKFGTLPQIYDVERVCMYCMSRGRTAKMSCSHCGGRGWIDAAVATNDA
jgi:hypothetical protein